MFNLFPNPESFSLLLRIVFSISALLVFAVVGVVGIITRVRASLKREKQRLKHA